MTIDASNVQTMMGPPDEVEATDTQGGDGDEVQTVTLSDVSDGTFRLAVEGETTAPIDYDASAAAVDSALEALNGVDNVNVTGSAGGPWTVTFAGNLSGVNVSMMNGDAATLATGTPDRTISYVFDAANQLTSASDPDSSYAYTYDNLGRVLTVDNTGTPGVPDVILSSAFDANSNRTSLSATIDSTDDFLNSYVYDNLDRLTRLDQVEQTGGNEVAEKRVDFAYNARGQYTSIARFNDSDGGTAYEIATALYTYDTLGRLTGLAYQQDGTDLFTPYSWTFDNLTNLLPLPLAGEGRGEGSADARVTAIARGAVFAGLGRITQVTSQDGTTDYDYDVTSQLRQPSTATRTMSPFLTTPTATARTPATSLARTTSCWTTEPTRTSTTTRATESNARKPPLAQQPNTTGTTATA